MHEGNAGQLGPGPGGYEHDSMLVHGGSQKALGASGQAFSFAANRHETSLPKWMVPEPPGPGEYRQPGSFGPQHCVAATTNKATEPAFKFGTEARDVKCRFYGNEGLSSGNRDTALGYNPGVKYATQISSLRNQTLSGSKTMPQVSIDGGGRREFGSMYQAQLQYLRLEREHEKREERLANSRTLSRFGKSINSPNRNSAEGKRRQSSEAAAEEILRFPSREPRIQVRNCHNNAMPQRSKTLSLGAMHYACIVTACEC